MKSHPKEASDTQRLDESHDEQPIIDFSKAFYAPYHPHARKMFEVLQKKFGITNVYKKTTTLGNLLFKRRPKRDKWNSTHVVYSVPCSEQPEQYIGQTKRKMITRIQPDINNDNGIPFHSATTGFQDTRILAREKNGFKRKITEGIHIYNKKDTCINIIAGHKIDNSWNPILKDLSL